MEDRALSLARPHNRPSLGPASDGRLRPASGFRAGPAEHYFISLDSRQMKARTPGPFVPSSTKYSCSYCYRCNTPPLPDPPRHHHPDPLLAHCCCPIDVVVWLLPSPLSSRGRYYCGHHHYHVVITGVLVVSGTVASAIAWPHESGRVSALQVRTTDGYTYHFFSSIVGPRGED
jgi:hypothetical protein